MLPAPTFNSYERDKIPLIIILAAVVAFIPVVAFWKYCMRRLFTTGPRISFFDECKYLYWQLKDLF
jgi:hypothetical protein